MVVLLEYKVNAYAYLVKAGRYTLDKDVPEDYRDVVAERLIKE